MNLKTNSLEKILLPAHVGDAGYDIIASSKPKIVGVEPITNYFSRIDYIEYDTDLIIAPDSGIHTYIFPRSSISKTNLVLANSVAVIDNGYRGTLKLRFRYLIQPNDLILSGRNILSEVNMNTVYQQGDKIAQLVFSETLTPNLELVKDFDETTRKQGGFGSTGV